MSRNLFKAELGFGIRDENSDTGVDLIQGAGAPPGTTGISDLAPIGSLWKDRTNGAVYQKFADTSSASDWRRVVDERIITALGITFGDEDMGAYSGNVLSDNAAQTTLNQELSDAIEGANFTDSVAVPAVTPTTIGAVNVDDFNYIEYEVWVTEDSDGSKREGFKYTLLHDGTSAADATTADGSVHSKLGIPGNTKVAGLSVDFALSGAGASQTIAMEVTTDNASTVKVRRTAVPN